jgi:hypothetical protein
MYIKKTYPARELVHIVLVDKDILGWLAGTEKQVKKRIHISRLSLPYHFENPFPGVESNVVGPIFSLTAPNHSLIFNQSL